MPSHTLQIILIKIISLSWMFDSICDEMLWNRKEKNLIKINRDPRRWFWKKIVESFQITFSQEANLLLVRAKFWWEIFLQRNFCSNMTVVKNLKISPQKMLRIFLRISPFYLKVESQKIESLSTEMFRNIQKFHILCFHYHNWTQR